ncbi:protein kinase domain-containing protein [Spirillospora sp. CA-253888]
MTMRPLQPGDPRTVGEYELAGRLGQGGMGTVYFGRTPSGRAVAVKVIRADFAGMPQLRRRFAAEVRAAMGVSAFYTAPVVDADPEGDPPWLVTAYIPGPTLDAAVDGYGPLPADSVRLLGAHLAEGLAAIHRGGLVHRDLKPGNVILAEDGPRIIDFGIALASGTTRHTVTSGPIGTPAYMSPEQARGEGDIDWRTDVFALGGVLVFAATGHGPFGDGRPEALIYRICAQEPDLAGVPAELREVVAACLAKEPADRPAPREVLERLRLPFAATGRTWLPADVGTMIAERAETGATQAAPAPTALAAETLEHTRAHPPPAAETAALPEADAPSADKGRHAADPPAGVSEPVPAASGAAAVLERSHSALQRGDLAEARRHYREAVASGDTGAVPVALYGLGNVAEREGDHAAARHWYERAAATGHTVIVPRALRRLGIAADEQGDLDQARRWYREAAATGHTGIAPTAMTDLAGVAERQGDREEARYWYERAAAGSHPNAAPHAMHCLGALAAQDGDLDAARHWYERAIATGHADYAPRAMRRLALTEQKRGDAKAAWHWFERAAATPHADAAPRAMRHLGLLARELGDPEGACAWFERAAATGHEDAAPRSLRSLGLIAQEAGRFAQARDWYERAVASAYPPVAPAAMNDLGVVAEKQGDLAGARAWYERAAASADAEIAPRAMHNLGFVAQDEGDLAGARLWWERAVATGHPAIASAARKNLRELAP